MSNQFNNNKYNNVFKPIDLTENDKKIRSIRIDYDDNDYDSINCDFSFIKNEKFNIENRMKFVVNNYDVNNIKINIDEDDEYQKFDFKNSLKPFRPFQYKSIRIRDDEKFERISNLTPSSEWPKITFLDDEKFKL